MHIFYRGKQAIQQFLVLYTHINYLGWYNISKKKALFYYIEELILQNFNIYTVALFLLHIHNKYNIKANSKAE